MSPKNPAASARQRLLDLAKELNEQFLTVLERYGAERLLRRMELSDLGGSFVLKGAALFRLWGIEGFRPTRDLDLLGFGDMGQERLEAIFRDICRSEGQERDGLAFAEESVRVQPIRKEEPYGGTRVVLEARLDGARIRLQVDVGVGDWVEPEPPAPFPTLLPDMPAPMVRAYPKETAAAEKFHAMASLGMGNSRLKDFFDVWTLARNFEFAGADLARSIAESFARRGSPVPAEPPVALTEDFSLNASKRSQWKGFAKRSRLDPDNPTLREAVSVSADFLMPPARAAASGHDFQQRWRPAEGWET